MGRGVPRDGAALPGGALHRRLGGGHPGRRPAAVTPLPRTAGARRRTAQSARIALACHNRRTMKFATTALRATAAAAFCALIVGCSLFHERNKEAPPPPPPPPGPVEALPTETQ